MSIYKRDEVLPEWEPVPWDLSGEAVDAQECGFHDRAVVAIEWQRVPWKAFPADGIFGHERDWFVSNDIAFIASHDSEDLILIQNTYHGFPDPPEWGLASRPRGRSDIAWSMWGHFPMVPEKWELPTDKE